MKKKLENIKNSIIETHKLLWQFKWYILLYILFIFFIIYDILNPPAEDSPLWGSEAMEGNWVYTNRDVYIGNSYYLLTIALLLFFLGTSNLRNHPMLAKLIFFLPLFRGIAYILWEILKLKIL